MGKSTIKYYEWRSIDGKIIEMMGGFFPHDESNDGWCFSKSSNSTKIPTSIKFPKFEG